MLPIVQRLLDGNQAARPEKGRSPRVIVLAPTRELAKQVGALMRTSSHLYSLLSGEFALCACSGMLR